MEKWKITEYRKQFDELRHEQDGVEYWLARELQPVLGYAKWDKFEGAIQRAMISCKTAEVDEDEHFYHYDRRVKGGKGAKIHDIIEEIEEQIDVIQEQIQSIMQKNLSSTSIYQLLLAFDKFYNDFTEVEQKEFMRAFIERIDIYPEKPDNGCWIKNIVFNFPVPINGKDIRELSLENETMLETCVLLVRTNVSEV